MSFISTTLTISENLGDSNSTQQLAIFKPIPEMIGIQSSSIDTLRSSSAAKDLLAFNALAPITQIQSDIISLGGNVGLGSTCYSSSTAIVTTLYGSLVTGIAVTYAEDIGINTVTSGIGSTDLVAYGILRYDILQAFVYPNMEPSTFNSATNNPLDGGGYITLTSLNLGSGNETRYTVGAGASAIVFALQGTGCAAYAGIAASISSLRSQYTTYSSGIATYLNGINTIKGLKNTSQLTFWSLNKVSGNLSSNIALNSSIINDLNT
jgi:hypothetical protein